MRILTALPLLGFAGLSVLFLTGCGANNASSFTSTTNSSAGVTTTTQAPPTTLVGGPVTTLPIVTTTTMRITTTTTTLRPVTTTSTTLKVTTTTTTLKPTTTTTTLKMTTTTTTMPSSNGANPTLGAHALAYFSCDSKGALKTAPMNTAASGSTVLVWTARGVGADVSAKNLPSSSIAGNGAPMQIGMTQTYAPLWKDSSEALYAWPNYMGGANNVISFPVPHQDDEISTVTVEVLNGGNIANYSFVKIISGANNSGNVTTTGPATLVAIWAGDAGANVSDAKPNNGFQIIETQYQANCGVEVTVATKEVSDAGTYNVNWTPNIPQGAHLWLVAVQKK